MTDRRTKRSELSSRRLLKAAGELIATSGYHSATLGAVGARAGYSSSLTTARFGSKAGLLDELVQDIFGRWSIEKMEPQLNDLTGAEALRVIIGGVRDAYCDSPHTVAVLNALVFEAASVSPEINQRIAEFHRNLRIRVQRYVERGVSDGSIRADVDPALTATLIVAQLRGASYLWMSQAPAVNVPRTLDHFIDFLSTQFERRPDRVSSPQTNARKSP